MYYRISSTPLPKLVSVYCIERNTTWRCADKNNLLIIVKKGCCYFSFNANDHLVKEGEAIFIPANTPYTRRPFEKTNCTFYYVHFFTNSLPTVISDEDMVSSAAEISEAETLSITQGEYAIPSFHDIFLSDISDFSRKREEIISILDDILGNDIKSGNPYKYLNASLSFAKLLTKLSHILIKNTSKEISKISNSSSFPTALQKALSYIRKNYKKKISVSTLAAEAGVSQQHLIRLFNTHLKTTPIKYINRSKIFHAIDMLRYTEMSIKEISYELGFDNPNYFSRLFTSEEGYSPSEIRERIKNYKDGPGALKEKHQ